MIDWLGGKREEKTMRSNLHFSFVETRKELHRPMYAISIMEKGIRSIDDASGQGFVPGKSTRHVRTRHREKQGHRSIDI